MLVITRREREVIWIGNAKVTILKTKGRIVRIGIEAPADIDIVRGELKPPDALAARDAAWDTALAAERGAAEVDPRWVVEDRRDPRSAD